MRIISLFIKAFGLIVAITLTTCLGASSSIASQLGTATNYQARINGVTDFLMQRAQSTALYLYEQRIRENQQLACYFPTTYETLNLYPQGTLKLFISSKAQWRNAMEADLETLLVRSFAREIEANINFSQLQVPIASDIIQALQVLEVEYQTRSGEMAFSQMTVTPLDASDAERQRLNKFYKPFTELLDSLRAFEPYTPNQQRSICQLPRFNYQQFSDEIRGLTQLPDTLKTWFAFIQQQQAKIQLRSDYAQLFNTNREAWQQFCQLARVNQPANCTSKDNALAQLTHLELLLSNYFKVIEPIQTLYHQVAALQGLSTTGAEQVQSSEMAQLAINLIKKWQSLAKLTDSTTTISLNQQDLWKLTQHIQFFALLSDAQTSKEVTGILNTFAMPATGFWQKRDAGSHLMLSSYFGLAYNLQSANLPIDANQTRNHGLFVPIGVEYTLDKEWFDLSDGAISIMVAPIDFGFPINLKLNDIEQDVELDELFTPSISISYGLHSWPVVFGAGYQKGAKYDANLKRENRFILFVAFDMPLFNLY